MGRKKGRSNRNPAPWATRERGLDLERNPKEETLDVQMDGRDFRVTIRSLLPGDFIDGSKMGPRDKVPQVLHRGLVDPPFSMAEARRMLDVNGPVGLELARHILRLSGVPETE